MGKSHYITDNWHTQFEKKSILIGMQNVFSVKAYAPYGLERIEFMFGIPLIGEADKAESVIEISLDRNLKIQKIRVVQKDNIIDIGSISASAKMVPCTNNIIDMVNACYYVKILCII